MTPKRIRLLYRAANHAPLWVTIEKAGIFAKHGLKVDMKAGLVRHKAVELLRRGEIDIISGNHHNLYAHRAQHGEPFVHLVQTVNDWLENQMAVSGGVRSVADLKGKRVVMDDFTSHKGLNVWLYLAFTVLIPKKVRLSCFP
jgi:ABC-type nitrate/sulfonate/bicarbonate transport system substrate-binding protein